MPLRRCVTGRNIRLGGWVRLTYWLQLGLFLGSAILGMGDWDIGCTRISVAICIVLLYNFVVHMPESVKTFHTAAWAIAILIPKSRWRCRLGTMKRLDCLGCREGDVVEFHDHTGQTEKQRAGSLWKPRWHWRYTYRCFMGMQRIRSGSQVVKMELFDVFSMTCRVGCLVCSQPHLRFRWAATI